MSMLSWQIHQEQLQIVYSHDLQISGSKTASVARETRNEINVLSITENSIGNSWITVNDYGYVYFLITNTDPSNKRGAEDSGNCRDLIKPLSVINGLWNLRNTIQALHIARYKPFHLFVFPGINSPLQWKWDGEKVSEILSPPQYIHISPVAPTQVQKNSYLKFQKATNGFLTSIPFDLQKSIHNQAGSSPNTSKKNANTGTMISICVDRLSVQMKYFHADSATVSEEQIKLKTDRVQTSRGGHFFDQPEKIDKYLINTDQIFRTKNPALREKIPGFLFGFIKKVIREKTVNEILNHIRNLPPDRFASVILNHIQVSGSVRPDFPQLPSREKRPVFLANHPTGGIDGLLLLGWLLNYYPDIKLLGNDVLQEIPHLHPYMVPVDRYGGSRASVRRILEVFASDTPLIIFPSGTTARKHKGELVEGPWQKMPARMSFKSDRILIPLHIRGWNSFLFYWTASLRRILNLDLNLEMLLLPREFLNPVCKHFTVSVGPGFTPKELESLGKSDQQRIDRLQKICQQLPEEHIAGVG